jgi:hypothetical protein
VLVIAKPNGYGSRMNRRCGDQGRSHKNSKPRQSRGQR